jgi:hypothetical protein
MFWDETPPPLLYFVHFQYAWWFFGTPLSLIRKILVLLRSHQAFVSSTNSLIVSFRQMTILVLQCKNHAFENQDHTSQPKLFAVSLHLFSNSACYCAYNCTCCIGSHSLVKYTGCRTSCKFEHCIVVFMKNYVLVNSSRSFSCQDCSKVILKKVHFLVSFLSSLFSKHYLCFLFKE